MKAKDYFEEKKPNIRELWNLSDTQKEIVYSLMEQYAELNIADVSTRFSLTNEQIETIANLFSRRECLLVEGQDTEWLLGHAFQLGMKAYRDLLNCQ